MKTVWRRELDMTHACIENLTPWTCHVNGVNKRAKKHSRNDIRRGFNVNEVRTILT